MKWLILSILTLNFSVFAGDLSVEDKKRLSQEIDYIGSLYTHTYAPKEWKEKHLGWDLPAQIALAQVNLAAAQDIKQARQAVANLIKSTADYHVSFSFYSTERAVLPFQVKTFSNQSIVVFIDRNKLSKAAFPFEVGDELLTVDQTPAAQILAELMASMGSNVPATDLAMADLYVTRRSAKANHVVPRGPVQISIKTKTGRVGTVQLTWEYTPEKLLPMKTLSPLVDQGPSSPLAETHFVKSELLNLDSELNTFGLGVRESFLPALGERIWQSAADNVFDAYLYKNEDQKLIGVVRIPSYITKDYEKAVKDFAGIIAHLEKHTQALVIDQNNNPGGSLFYLYALASMLTDQTLSAPRHREALAADRAQECLQLSEKLKDVKNDTEAAAQLGGLGGYPPSYQLAVAVQAYCDNILTEFRSGKRLSSPQYLWGIDRINPNPVHYTRPILFLVNELDFSGGDFMPAILQDNKRVTVVGMRTAGAGGYINQASFANGFGLESISLTGSLAERIDKNPIENLGVTPDVLLPMTVVDLQTGFNPYVTSLRALIKQIAR